MAFKQMDKKAKLKKVLSITSTVLVVVMALIVAVVVFKRYVIPTDKSKSVITNSQQEAAATTEAGIVNIAIVKEKLSPGDIVGPNKVNMEMRHEKDVPKDAVKSLTSLENMRMKVQREPNEILLSTDLVPEDSWYEGEDRYTEHKFLPEAIPAVVQVGSIIDIKLLKTGGEDPIVVSKVVVESRTGDVLGFYLNFEEQEYIKEAASEGLLFVTVYADKNQPASDVTYTTNYGLKNKNSTVKEGNTESFVNGSGQ